MAEQLDLVDYMNDKQAEEMCQSYYKGRGILVVVDDGVLTLSKDEAYSLEVGPVVQWADWLTGPGFIQDVYRHLSTDDREFILTGLTPEEWSDMFPPDEPDEDTIDDAKDMDAEIHAMFYGDDDLDT